MVLGGLLLLSGFIAFGSMGGVLEEAFDPRITNVLEVESAGEGLADLRTGCHSLYVERGVEMNATLLLSDGWSTSGAPLEEATCTTEWQPMSTDRTEFERVASWRVSEAGEHLLQVEGSEGAQAWLIDVNAMEQGMFSSPWIIGAFGLCIMGFVLLPIGLFMVMSERRRKARAIFVVDAEGGVRPMAMPQTEDEASRFIEDLRGDGLPFDPITGTYRKEATGPAQGPEQDLPDGMLTTEQVYALMRGDLEGALPPQVREAQARDPFVSTSRAEARAPPATKPAPKEATGQDWMAWDEGP